MGDMLLELVILFLTDLVACPRPKGSGVVDPLFFAFFPIFSHEDGPGDVIGIFVDDTSDPIVL